MEDLVLREATEDDAATIVAVVHAAFEEYRGRLDPPSGAHGETVEQVRRKMVTARVVLASLRVKPGGSDVVAGCVFYEPREDHLYLFRLAVLPAYRRRGVGRILIANVEQQARALQLGRVRLGVRLALAPLRAYYERIGYRVVEYGTHAGYPVPTYVMLEKNLLA